LAAILKMADILKILKTQNWSSVDFVLLSLVSFYFVFISLISFRFVFVDFVSFRFVSISFRTL
jgi:hypothetical protein